MSAFRPSGHYKHWADWIVDEEGLEFADLDLARQHPRAAAAEIAANDLKRGFDHLEQRIRITDHAGAELASIAIEAWLKLRA